MIKLFENQVLPRRSKLSRHTQPVLVRIGQASGGKDLSECALILVERVQTQLGPQLRRISALAAFTRAWNNPHGLAPRYIDLSLPVPPDPAQRYGCRTSDRRKLLLTRVFESFVLYCNARPHPHISILSASPFLFLGSISSINPVFSGSSISNPLSTSRRGCRFVA